MAQSQRCIGRIAGVLLLAGVTAHATTLVDFGAKFGSGWPRGELPQYYPPTVDRTDDGTLTNDFVSAYIFSETVPFTPPGLDFDTNALSAMFFGGMTLYTHADEGPRPLTEGHLNQNHEFRDDFNLMTLPAPRTNAVSGLVEELLEAYGVFFWAKEHFYNGGADHAVTFDTNSYLAVDVTRYWAGLNAGRWLVRDGDTYYLSEATFAGSTTQIDTVTFTNSNPVVRQTHTLHPHTTDWAIYTPVPDTNQPWVIDFDPGAAVFAPRTFTNVTAVGFFVERYLSTPYRASDALTVGEPIALKWGAFRAEAVIDAPAASSRTLAMHDLGGVYLASNAVPYDLWRAMFRFGQRRQHVRDDLGVGGYSFERDGSMGAMRATGGAHHRLEPVTDITWYDAVLFCNALSQWEGLEPAYYTDAAYTHPVKQAFNRSVREDWTNRPTVYWKTNAPGYRLPTPAEWAAMPVAVQVTGQWEHVWFPAGAVADPAVDTTRTALGWDPAAPTNSILTFGEHPWWGSPRLTFRPVRNGAGTPINGPASGATAWDYTAATVLPATNPPNPDALRTLIAQDLPEVVLADGGLANPSHAVDLGFDPAEAIDPATAYPVKVGATEVPYRLWNLVQQWALDQGYTFNYAGAMGSMGALAGDDRLFSPDEPVTQMSWYDLVVWCNALSDMLDLEPVYYRDGGFSTVWRDATQFRLETFKGKGYPNHGQLPAEPVDTGYYLTNYMNTAANGFRIPLPQEWDRANAVDANSASNTHNWLRDNANGKTQPVGTLLPNGLGLHDMEGNVREWTWGDTRATINRVTRRKGSHFARGFQDSHSYIDSHEVPSVGSTHVGFRTVRLNQELSATPDVISMAGTSDQTFTPRILTVSNTGYTAVSYTITTSASWMAVTPSAFTNLGNGEAADHSLTFNTPLAGGTYTGEIVILPDNPAIPALTAAVHVVITVRGTGEVVTARVDFGTPDQTTTGNWNNLTDPVAGAVSGLIDLDGFDNAIEVAVTTPFAAALDGGTTAADPTLDLPATASRDGVTGGNPSSRVIGWGGDYILGTSLQQMTWQLAADALNESVIRSPGSSDFNRNAPGGTFYANARSGPDTSINYFHIEDNGGTNRIAFQYRRDNTVGDIIGHAAFVWMKTNFLNGFEAADTRITRLSLTGGSTGAAGTNLLRWLIRQGAQYYLSSNTYAVPAGVTVSLTESVDAIGGWEAYNPATDLAYTPGTFAPLDLTNITAVGYYSHAHRTGASAGQFLRLNVTGFDAYGQVAGTQPATSSTVRISGLNTNFHYTLSLFASLLNPGANLQTETRIAHADGVVTNRLDPADNTAAIITTASLRPDANGRLTLDLLAGPGNNDPEGRYLLGALSITFTNQLPLPGGGDTDDDGIPDWWETQHFGGPTNAMATALAANGVNTLLEAFLADLAPSDPDAFWVLTGAHASGTGPQVSWPVVSGRVYHVYGTTNLATPFLLLETGLATGTHVGVVAEDAPIGFYRVDLEKVQP